MRILGLSAFYHDSAACLLIDGEIAAAVQEERFTRKKHDAGFPLQAISYCLDVADLRPEDIDYVVFYDKPFLKFERILETYLAFAPRGFKSFVTSLPVWLKEKLFQKKMILDALKAHLGEHVDWASRLLFSEHHLSHAASAFFASPFEDAAVLTMDGVGEWTTTSIAVGKGNQLDILREIYFPHSLGLLYSAFTYYTGFKVNSGEYKVMGLAPYGIPRYADLIKSHLIDIRNDGSFQLDMTYFNYAAGLTMTNERFDRLFGGPARRPEAALTQREMDLAASIQSVIEEVVIKLARHIREITGHRNLCLAGGVALNCVANGKLLQAGIFEGIWIQPAAGDSGGAVGAAFAAHHMALALPRAVNPSDAMHGTYLGPEYNQAAIEKRLSQAGARFSTVSEVEVIDLAVKALIAGKAVGWHQGRMEFGPRALGNRSIIADPRSPSVQRQLNLKVKYRESFRPFAPSVLAEDVQDWFHIDVPSPYMLLVAEVAKLRQLPLSDVQRGLFGIDRLNIPRSDIPAVTHVDYSARIQTVHREINPLYHSLISAFKAATGCPILVNTSFNVRGEPIVCTPEDAFRCFMGTGIEMLVVGNCILRKEDQNEAHFKDYSYAYDLD